MISIIVFDFEIINYYYDLIISEFSHFITISILFS